MAESRPNIILIMCDQMRWDAAGFAGSAIVQTPHLDRLADVCFENAYCASPVCSPARASWLTGCYPHAHLQLRNYGPKRGKTWGSYLPPDCVTLGDILKRAGYRCGMVGPWHLGDDHMPTLLALANEVPPENIDGRSVADAILNGRQPEPRPIFAEIASQEALYFSSEERAQFAAHVMNRDGRWKYIRNRFDIDELYDLQTDPNEMQNLAQLPTHQPRIATMRGQIAEMICHTGPGPYEWCLDV